MKRGETPAVSQSRTNSLHEVFTDLMAYVIFFENSCAQQPPSPGEFREKVLALVNAQEERMKTHGVAAEAFREARFAVLSWVDEMILNSNWPHRAQWQHLMLGYYGTLNAGEEFFRRLELLPSQANDIREIYYLCLSLGFQGRYAFGDERQEMLNLKQTLYRQLCANHGDIRQTYPRLFPEAYQKIAAPAPGAPKKKWLWLITAASLPVILFVGYWLILRNETNRLIAMINKPAIHAVMVDWSRSLVEELRRKGIPAEDTARGVLITLESLLFEVNSADLSRQAQRKIDDIVETVKKYAPERNIVVEGHASKEKGVDEARNQQLSEARAITVAETFKSSGFVSDRIVARGFGSKIRVADNETEQGRAKNRRVEIIVRK
jgi:type VI secretion system protein ImpK